MGLSEELVCDQSVLVQDLLCEAGHPVAIVAMLVVVYRHNALHAVLHKVQASHSRERRIPSEAHCFFIIIVVIIIVLRTSFLPLLRLRYSLLERHLALLLSLLLPLGDRREHAVMPLRQGDVVEEEAGQQQVHTLTGFLLRLRFVLLVLVAIIIIVINTTSGSGRISPSPDVVVHGAGMRDEELCDDKEADGKVHAQHTLSPQGAEDRRWAVCTVRSCMRRSGERHSALSGCK